MKIKPAKIKKETTQDDMVIAVKAFFNS